jgi:hypothetical protein
VTAALLLCVAVSCGGGGNSSIQKSPDTSVVAEPTSAGTDSASAGSPANDATGGVLGSKCDKPGDTKTVNGIDLMCDKADGKNPVWMKNKYSSGGGNDPGKNDGGDPSKNDGKKKGNYPDSPDAPECPADITGILTSPMFKPEDLLFITPLGNVTPPGHTAPIDHQYITPSRGGKIPLYAPADGFIARMQPGGYSDDGGKTLKLDSFVFSLVVCRGLVLETTGNAAMEDLNPAIRAVLPADPAQAPKDACTFGLHKVGHAHQWEWM